MSTRVLADTILRISVPRHVDTIDTINSISTMPNKDTVATSSGHVQPDIVISQINITNTIDLCRFTIAYLPSLYTMNTWVYLVAVNVDLSDNFTLTGASTRMEGLKDCTLGFEFEGMKGTLNF